jgi:monomeric isocitrate dehydrogenase
LKSRKIFKDHDTTGLDIRIETVEATIFTLEGTKKS